MFTQEGGSPPFPPTTSSLQKGLVKGKSATSPEMLQSFTPIYQQDFSDPEKQKEELNKWVWRRTNIKKIKELICLKVNVTSDTAMAW